MTRVIDADTYRKNRDHAKFHGRDIEAEKTLAGLSGSQRLKLMAGPIKVGEVDFGQWPKEDERYGTLRRLPLYLHVHGKHVFECYAAGFPGHNERIECHCGYRHYFLSTRLKPLRAIRDLIRLRISGVV